MWERRVQFVIFFYKDWSSAIEKRCTKRRCTKRKRRGMKKENFETEDMYYSKSRCSVRRRSKSSAQTQHKRCRGKGWRTKLKGGSRAVR